MVFTRGDALKTITQGLAWIATTCELQGGLKLFDDHLLAQPFFRRVLNVAYSLELEVMDRIRPNFPAIDLGDSTNRVAFQITTERRAEKVQHTLDKFVEHGLHLAFDLLRILIIGEPQATYKTVVIPRGLPFDRDRDILGISGLVKHIETLGTPCIIEIAGIFAEELSHFKAPGGATDEPSEEEKALTAFVERYRLFVEKNRGYITSQILVLLRLTDLAAWQRGLVDGTLKRFKSLCDSRDAFMASPETAALVGSVGILLPMLKDQILAPSEDDVRQRTAWEHWSKLTYEFGERGPQSDLQVQAWQQACLAFLNASLAALLTKERLVKEAVGKWRADKAAMVQGNTLYHRALVKVQAGDRNGALADYEALLALPNLPGVLRAAARFDRALITSKAGDRPGALTEYSTLLEIPDIHPHQYAKALLNRGVEKNAANDPAGALADFDLLIGLADAPNDQRAMAFFNRASLKNTAGEREAAMADLDAGLGLPGVPTEKRARALFTRGTAKAESGDRAGARSDFDALLAVPDMPSELRAQALLYRGAEKSWDGDRAGALADFDAVLALCDVAPGYWAEAMINRGAEKLESGDQQGSLNDFDAALAMPALSARHRLIALMQRACAKAEAGDSAGALADYEAILALPDLPAEQKTQVSYNRAVTKCEVGDWTGALADFDVVLNLSNLPPEFRAHALFNRAGAKQVAGDRAGALADYDALLALPDLSADLRSEALAKMALAKAEPGDSTAGE